MQYENYVPDPMRNNPYKDQLSSLSNLINANLNLLQTNQDTASKEYTKLSLIQSLLNSLIKNLNDIDFSRGGNQSSLDLKFEIEELIKATKYLQSNYKMLKHNATLYTENNQNILNNLQDLD